MDKQGTTIINLTGHIVRVKSSDGSFNDIEPAGSVRLSSTTMNIGTINGIPITKVKFGAGENLPDEEPNTIYIVSKIVCEACPTRCDFYLPTGKASNADGVIHCRSLSPNPYCVLFNNDVDEATT